MTACGWGWGTPGGHDPPAGCGKQSPACSRGHGGPMGTRVSNPASCPCATWGPRGHCHGRRHTAPVSVRLRASRGRSGCQRPAPGHAGSASRTGRPRPGTPRAHRPWGRASRGPAHRLQAQHGPAQRAVSQEPQAARVRGQVPPDVAAALCPQVQGHDEAAVLHVLAQLLQDAARLAHQGPCRAAGVTTAPLARTDAAAL